LRRPPGDPAHGAPEQDGAEEPKVVIADYDGLARRIIRETLERAGMTVVAEARTGREAVDVTLRHRPRILLMDLLLPALDVNEAITRIREGTDGEIAIVVLTPIDDAQLAVSVLRAGAVGWLAKDMALEALPRALRGVVNGEAAITRGVMRLVVEQLHRAPVGELGFRPVRSLLSQREWEVLDMLCVGAVPDEIGAALGISPQTVRAHINAILRKTDLGSLKELVAMAPSLRNVALDRPGAVGPVGLRHPFRHHHDVRIGDGHRRSAPGARDDAASSI
jgi:two-component system, NarL family, response regulator LiaR